MNTIRDIIVFIKHYCGMHVSEHCQIGNGRVELWDKEIATFEFDSKSGMPIFTFVKPEWEQSQQENSWKVLEELFGYPVFKKLDSPNKTYFLGTLLYRIPFSRENVKVDVYFDQDRHEMVSKTADGSNTYQFWSLCNSSDPTEQEAFKRAWALIHTDKPADFQGWLQRVDTLQS